MICSKPYTHYSLLLWRNHLYRDGYECARERCEWVRNENESIGNGFECMKDICEGISNLA